MTTLVFPGQGSQKKGMGEGLFEQFSEHTQAADQILGYSIAELCLQDTQNQLKQTQFTQPALYTVSSLTYLAYKNANPPANFVAGHSVGEYAALFAAEVFDFETGLKLVQKRGELMSQAQGGAMSAVIGLDASQIKTILQQNGLETIDVANYNSPQQIVISGLYDDIQKANQVFEQEARMCIPLPVSGAFHSRYMQQAQNAFADFIQSFSFNAPSIPVIANVTAKPYENDAISENLIQQITHSVLWVDSVNYLLQQGESDFEEMGPGNVLKGLIKQIQSTQ